MSGSYERTPDRYERGQRECVHRVGRAQTITHLWVGEVGGIDNELCVTARTWGGSPERCPVLRTADSVDALALASFAPIRRPFVPVRSASKGGLARGHSLVGASCKHPTTVFTRSAPDRSGGRSRRRCARRRSESDSGPSGCIRPTLRRVPTLETNMAGFWRSPGNGAACWRPASHQTRRRVGSTCVRATETRGPKARAAPAFAMRGQS